MIAIAALVATRAGAQSIPGAVLAQREPHHHRAYEDAVLRVLRVHVAAGDTTLLHEHDPDYFWVSIGASEIVNAKLGAPDAVVKSANLSFHYTPGKFAHVARNHTKAPFDNITVELLQPQTNVHNRCETVMGNEPLGCPRSTNALALVSGATDHPAFTTDQLRVSLATLAPGGVMHPTTTVKNAWLIAIDTLDVPSLTASGSGAWAGGVIRETGSDWSVRNAGRASSRIIIVAPAAASKASASKRSTGAP